MSLIVPMVTLILALALGCVSSAPSLTGTPVPYKPLQLHVKLDPKESATVLLNPSPLGEGGYSQGMVVNIDILPKQGWQVYKWVGPVYNIDGITAQIQMDASLEVVVRLIPTIPPTATPITVSTATPRPFTPWLMDLSTATPRPKATPRPTATPKETAKIDAAFYSMKGMDYWHADNWSIAIDQFTKAMQLDTYIYYYDKRGYAHHALGQYENAVSDYTKAIKFDPEYGRTYYNRGNSYEKLGQYQNAIADYTKAIKVNPYNGSAYTSRGNAHQELGQYQTAITDYDKAIQLDPDYASAYYNRGYTYWRISQKGKFREDRRKSCSLDSRLC